MINLKKVLRLFVICILFTIILPVTVRADIGPKPELKVYVKNPPDEIYYLDLLITGSNNYSQLDKKLYNTEMLDLLNSYEDEGWHPALTAGTNIPLFGKLTGEPSGNYMVHNFSYMGVPDIYRIIIVTESGKVTVTDEYKRDTYQGSVTYDYLTGTVKQMPLPAAYLVQFATTFGLTLILEGLILLLFKYKLKENFKVFFITNFITQVFLTLAVGTSFAVNGGMAAFLIHIPVELIIIITEVLIYKKFLKGRSNLLNVVYGLVANIASWLLGFIILNFTLERILKMIL